MTFEDLLLCEFDVGDLVRLNEDIRLQIGYGLVVDVKNNFDDVYDMEYLTQKILKFKELTADTRNEEFYPTKPQILVMWNNTINGDKKLWMYASELTIVQKVGKDTK